MRKYVITILAVLVQLQFAAAAVVPQERAARYAAGLLGMSSLPVAEQSTSQHAPVRGTAQAPDYYVFNNPAGGWVILSAEDRIMPVIAYSDEGSFRTEGMPDNITEWMDGVSRAIAGVRADDSAVPAAVSEAWAQLGQTPKSSATGKYYETANWDQEDPYNRKCPRDPIDGKTSAAGCMATAMAIVMRYYEWPQSGTGIIGNYITETRRILINDRINLGKRVYEWSNMPLTNAASAQNWTPAQKSAVAELIYDCGVMLKMDYTYSLGSGAYTDDVIPAMKKHLFYSDKMALQYRSSYPLSKWFSMIVKEIDSGRIVLYGGSSDKGGHAFVCDGYDLEGSKLHINWGWGGTDNGFFTLDLVHGKDDIYNSLQYAILGIAPNTFSVVNDNEYADFMFFYGEDYSGEKYMGLKPMNTGGKNAPVDIVKDSRLCFSFGGLMNMNDRPVDVNFQVCLMDSSGRERQRGWQVMIQSEEYGLFCIPQTNASTLTVEPALTDYFQVFYSLDDGMTWKPVVPNYEYDDTRGLCCGVTPDPVIVLPEHCHAGQETDLKLTLGYVPYKNVRWSLNGTEFSGSKIVLGAGPNFIQATLEFYDGSTGTIWTTVNAE